MLNDHKTRVSELQDHISKFADWFNETSGKQSLGVALDAEGILQSIEYMDEDTVLQRHAEMTEHKVHEEQVVTAVNAIAMTVEAPGQSGVILGALQSGKTGTAFTALFAAPIHYLKSKVTFVPIFMTTNQNSHMAQTQKAMRAFFNLYGSIKIVSDGETRSLIDYYQESGADLVETPDGEKETTLRRYHSAIVDDMYPGTDVVDALVKDMTVKRVPTGISKKVRSYCERAREKGHGVMLIVDEPQYGASNQIKKNGDEVDCLLTRLFRQVDTDFFDPNTPSFVIGLSATPFDTANLRNIWQVKQKLNGSYFGPNAFNGEPIDPTVVTRLPRVESFSDIAAAPNMQGFKEIAYLTGAADKPNRKSFKPTVIGLDGKSRPMDLLERRRTGAKLVRQLLDDKLLPVQRNESQPVGVLLRIANNKRITQDVLEVMGLGGEDSPYNVIPFYSGGGDIKRAIWDATRNDKRPYVVVTIGKGRMGDAFPPSTVMSVDLTNSVTDANAFLQGGYGRMCGYNKKDPLVITNDDGKTFIHQYMKNVGIAPDYKKSKHVASAALRRGRNKTESYFMITDEMISNDHDNSPLRAFRDDIVAYLESQELSKETPNPNVPHRANQYMNLPEIMKRHGVIGYIEKNSERLDRELQGPAKIVDFDGSTTYTRRDGTEETIHYEKNGEGGVKTLVSKVAYDSNDTSYDKVVGGSRGLSSNGRREPAKHVNRGRRGGNIMPVITVKKVDADGNIVSLKEKGRYVFDGIVFSLENEVHRYRRAETLSAAARGSAWSDVMTGEDRADQLAVYIANHMKGKWERSFLEALGMNDVHDIVRRLYDDSTHTFTVEGQTLKFRDKETGELDNPHGPAVIDMTDFRSVKVRYHAIERDISESQAFENQDQDLEQEVHLEQIPAQTMGMW